MPDDWFVVNVADAPALRNERGGTSVRFESPEAPFPDLGIGIRELQPGQPNGKYHSENVQEDFLVLSGECVVIIDGEERALRAWDFVHCPAGTEHIFVGAGEGPCHILMVGARGRTSGCTTRSTSWPRATARRSRSRPRCPPRPTPTGRGSSRRRGCSGRLADPQPSSASRSRAFAPVESKGWRS